MFPFGAVGDDSHVFSSVKHTVTSSAVTDTAAKELFLPVKKGGSDNTAGNDDCFCFEHFIWCNQCKGFTGKDIDDLFFDHYRIMRHGVGHKAVHHTLAGDLGHTGIVVNDMSPTQLGAKVSPFKNCHIFVANFSCQGRRQTCGTTANDGDIIYMVAHFFILSLLPFLFGVKIDKLGAQNTVNRLDFHHQRCRYILVNGNGHDIGSCRCGAADLHAGNIDILVT